MKNICLTITGLIFFMFHLNLTIVAFAKSSAIYMDKKTIAWRNILEYLSIPISHVSKYLFIDNIIILIMLNSLIWTCLTVFSIWCLTVFSIWCLNMFKKTGNV